MVVFARLGLFGNNGVLGDGVFFLHSEAFFPWRCDFFLSFLFFVSWKRPGHTDIVGGGRRRCVITVLN
jgi:hypothetical protein